MRSERAARLTQTGSVKLDLSSAAGERSGHVVFDADRISKAFGDRVVVRDFSTRVMRGDRIGLVGPNGIGKTTLLKMLVGELPPDSGSIDRGTNVQVAYFDQQRAQLDPEQTVVASVGEGNDTVTIGGRTRHIYGYLEDFLFPPDRAQAKVKMLSGGERNRLLLARLLTQPANVLILDEPTNDLDLETLSVLEAELTDFPGTILVVSHDRVFLDNIVTSTWLFTGEGRIEELVGTDIDRWLVPEPSSAPAKTVAAPAKTAAVPARSAGKKKLSYKEQREFDALPDQISAVETEERVLQQRIDSPEFYKEGPKAIKDALTRVEQLRAERDALYARWSELDARTQ
jgi:ATP-binding cassette subfamily F protein uup